MNTNQINNKLIARWLYCSLFVVTCFLSSCESWVDVTPNDRIVESKAFEQLKGYQKQLNGLYSAMNKNALYGQNLTAMVDVMAQYYDVPPRYSLYASYKYEVDDMKNSMSNIWSQGYRLISNANTIIDHTEGNDVPLTDVQRKRIRGEALAVRAFMHFDLLRLFGPMPSALNERAIPYQTSAVLEVQPIESGQQIMTKIKADLNEAITLLQETEPLLIPDRYEAIDIESRPYCMNVFAVKAVLARVCLWEGDRSSAYRLATEVINQAEPFFPYTPATTAGNEDNRCFASEVLFGMYDTSRQTGIFNALFNPTLGKTYLLTAFGGLSGGRLDSWYDDQNDYRYKSWAVDVIDGSDVLYNSKFKNVPDGGTINYLVPLVRMGEMYLIAAECSDNIEEAYRFVNTLRERRNCHALDINEETALENLIAEYRREFLGEGQLFFLYKRLGLTEIPDGSSATATISMGRTQYVVPLPESETNQRSSVNADYVEW